MKELWISKETGKRRHGTHYSDIRMLFHDGINGNSIYEPLYCCMYNDSAIDTKENMLKLDFDVVGLKQGEATPILEYIKKDELDAGLCKEYKRMIELSEIISVNTPIIDILNNLKEKERLFVLKSSYIEGIITRADLQKPPVRLFFFSLVTILEMHLTFWIRKYYKDITWKSNLSEKRIEQAEKLYKERQERNEELDLIDCLQFCDKRDLILKKDNLVNELQFSSKTSAEKTLKDTEKLRNKLAHSQNIVTGTNWGDIIDLVNNIETIINTSELNIKNLVAS
jgi:hypothetical protein